jgi:glutamyl endopeptidase
MTYLITELKRAVLWSLPAFALLAAATATAMAGHSRDIAPGPAGGNDLAWPAYEGTGKPVNSPVADEPIPPPVDSGLGVETIIGLDKRVQVTDTTAFPARATALITFGGGSCTGFMIGKDTVATAGHCVYESGAWRTNVEVYPGRNGSSSPYGSCAARQNSQPGVGLFSNRRWISLGDERYDYGAIKLDCSVGNATGWYALWTQSDLVGVNTTINGYPGDKPAGTQWRSSDCSNNSFFFVQCTVATETTRQLFYSNDTFAGNSGSPVYFSGVRGCPCAIGIHAYGLHGSYPHDTYNHGARTLTGVINFLSGVRDKL